jgi:phosphomannomutase
VLVAAGFEVRYLDEPAPTPVLAYLAKQLGAVGAVIITASHNPPADNGYKVYSSNAVQIVPPEDRMISEAIARVGPAAEVPRDDDPFSSPRATPITPDLVAGYLDAVAAAMPAGAVARPDLGIVYSAMHGVGGRTLVALFERFGFTTLHPVEAQFHPDGRFPTVAFPNPEEPGAMDLANALAAETDADLVIANDPDADRLAVSLPGPGGGYHQLSGNQIGVLLADYLLGHATVANPLVIQSIVSSPMLASVAAAHGAGYERTLTGFKWICNAALALADRSTFVFGYEEALGYSVGRTVRDKDGISAALAFALMASGDLSVWERLGRLYRTHGLWVSTQKSVVRTGTAGAEQIAAAMAGLEGRVPDSLAGHPVSAITDYRRGEESRPMWLPNTDLVEYTLGDAGRALIRPSGTEPKIKIYVDLRGDPGSDWTISQHGLLSEAAAVADELAGFAGL